MNPGNAAITPDLPAAIASADHWLALALTTVLVAATVFLHYEALERLNYGIGSWRMRPRARVLALIVAIMVLHIAEIWIFGVGIYAASLFPGLGAIVGTDSLMLLDAIYVSATTYTTLGFGDLTPVGPIRLLVGTESLVGFVMLTWSASFTYLEMQRYWRPR